MQRTLVLLKPDCLQRRLMSQVLGRIEAKGLHLVAMKMLRITPEMSKQHYAEHLAKPFYPNLEEFITSAPSVAMILEGLDAIEVVRGMLGATNGRKAAAGTIRGDFGMSGQLNLVHASDGPESAAREIALYFRPEEICADSPTLHCWINTAEECPPG